MITMPYLFQIGAIRGQILADGHDVLTLERVARMFPDHADQIQAASGKSLGTMSRNILLLDVGDERILIDSGEGNMVAESPGTLFASLAIYEIDLDSIDTVIITHFHLDHIGGLLDGHGKPTFPNARLVASKAEFDHWMNENFLATMEALHDIIRNDVERTERAIRVKLAGDYNDKKGDYIENIIRAKLDQISEQFGVPHAKGQVTLVTKEVDHAVPSLNDPFVLIMTSYMETTSSSQTIRANEQIAMYLKLRDNFIHQGKRRVLINFVDGAGWLARRSDLRKMRDGCDHIINLTTLDQLEAIICKYVPETYFKGKRPQVEG